MNERVQGMQGGCGIFSRFYGEGEGTFFKSRSNRSSSDESPMSSK